MRFPESKIKEAILHPEAVIRCRATRYFAESYSADPSIMPMVIDAVELYDYQEDNEQLLMVARRLPQCEETIDWIIDELHMEECLEFPSYAFCLSMLLVCADPLLILPRKAAILEARYFDEDLVDRLEERLEMHSWDAATCWQKLVEFCEAEKHEREIEDVVWGNAERIVEALARYGDKCEPKVHEFLGVKVDNYRSHPMKWLEPLVVRLAGRAHLESTIPMIIAKLNQDEDGSKNSAAEVLYEECEEALIRIGTPAVVHAIGEAFSTAQPNFRYHALGPLTHIHSDKAVETCIKLLEQENEDEHRIELAFTLLGQFAAEGIEIARQLVLDHEGDIGVEPLRYCLLETCTLTGERFPEYEEWSAVGRDEIDDDWDDPSDYEDAPSSPLSIALGDLIGTKPTEMNTPLPMMPVSTPYRRPESQPRVGRNDRCPCGSGKKFKNCCIGS